MKKKKRKKPPLHKRKANPNSNYWRNKADEQASKYYRHLPCKVCESEGVENTDTCWHHIVPKSLSAHYRHDPDNLISLCNKHHNTDNDIAAHGTNPLAQEGFLNWLREHRPKGVEMLDSYKMHKNEKVDYEQAYLEWKELNSDDR